MSLEINVLLISQTHNILEEKRFYKNETCRWFVIINWYTRNPISLMPLSIQLDTIYDENMMVTMVMGMKVVLLSGYEITRTDVGWG